MKSGNQTIIILQSDKRKPVRHRKSYKRPPGELCAKSEAPSKGRSHRTDRRGTKQLDFTPFQPKIYPFPHILNAFRL